MCVFACVRVRMCARVRVYVCVCACVGTCVGTVFVCGLYRGIVHIICIVWHWTSIWTISRDTSIDRLSKLVATRQPFRTKLEHMALTYIPFSWIGHVLWRKLFKGRVPALLPRIGPEVICKGKEICIERWKIKHKMVLRYNWYNSASFGIITNQFCFEIGRFIYHLNVLRVESFKLLHA